MTLFLFVFNSLTGQETKQLDPREAFTNEFISNKRVHFILKERLEKNEVRILDKDSLITEKPINYYDDGIKIIIDNKLSESDLFVRYYIINTDLAYAVFFRHINEGISFIFVKKGGKWNFFDYTVRETR